MTIHCPIIAALSPQSSNHAVRLEDFLLPTGARSLRLERGAPAAMPVSSPVILGIGAGNGHKLFVFRFQERPR